MSKLGRAEEIPISGKKYLVSLLWVLCWPLLFVVIGAPGVFACVMMISNGLGVKEIVALVFFVAVLGVLVLFMIATFPTLRLLLFSLRPGSYYLLKKDMLQRYAKDDALVEQIPFENIADIRLINTRSAMDENVKYQVLAIDLRKRKQRDTILDPIFLRWSKSSQGYDIALIDQFFDVPIKSVYRKIKKRWQAWSEQLEEEEDEGDADK